MEVSKSLKRLREMSGVSISELARKSGVSKGLISDLESDKRTNPCVDTIVKLADAMGFEFQLAFTPLSKAQPEEREEFSRPGVHGVYAGNYNASKFTDVIKLNPKGGDAPCPCSPNAAVSNAPETVQSRSDAQEAITRIANHLSFNGTPLELAELIEGFQVKHVNLNPQPEGKQ